MNLRSPTTLLKDSITFYKTHFKSLTAIALLPAILLAIGNTILDANTAADGTILLDSFSPVEVGISAVLWIAGLVFSLISSIALTLFVAHPASYSTWTGAYASARKYFFPYLWVFILEGLAIIGGFILLIIPGIIIAVLLTFSLFTMLLENKRGTSALKASKALVKGRWWSVFFRALVLSLAMLVIILGLPFILGIFVPDTPVADALSNFIGALIMPIATIYSYFLYKDLKTH